MLLISSQSQQVSVFSGREDIVALIAVNPAHGLGPDFSLETKNYPHL